jgi:hypothetical protein
VGSFVDRGELRNKNKTENKKLKQTNKKPQKMKIKNK